MSLAIHAALVTGTTITAGKVCYELGNRFIEHENPKKKFAGRLLQTAHAISTAACVRFMLDLSEKQFFHVVSSLPLITLGFAGIPAGLSKLYKQRDLATAIKTVSLGAIVFGGLATLEEPDILIIGAATLAAYICTNPFNERNK